MPRFQPVAPPDTPMDELTPAAQKATSARAGVHPAPPTRALAFTLGTALLAGAAAGLVSHGGHWIPVRSSLLTATALLALALPTHVPWRRTATAAALVLATHSCALDLTRSGDWGMGWRSWGEISREGGVTSLLLLGLLAVAAATLLWETLTGRRRSATTQSSLPSGSSDASRLRRDALLAFAGAVLLGTLLSRSAVEYGLGLLLSAWTYGLAALLAIVAAVSLPRDTLATLAGRVRALRRDSTRGLSRRLPILLAAWCVVAASILAWIVFDHIPHVPDEVSYWFQAKYLSRGMLYAPAAPDPVAFELPYVLQQDERWYGIFPPAWPALLAAGMVLGVPWIVNPLLGGCAVLLMYALVREMYGTSLARLAATLLATSPMFLLMSAGLMSHPASLVFSLAAIFGIHRALVRDRLLPAAAGGFALGALALTRPIEAVIFAVVLTLYAAFFRTARRGRALTTFLAPAILVAGLTLPYNALLTGDALYDPITRYFDEVYYPGSNRLGFGADVGNTDWLNDLYPGHSPQEAALNAHRDLYLLNLEALGWSAGSLLPALFFLVTAAASRTSSGIRLRREDGLFLGLGAAVPLAYGLYWYAAPDYGARYWYQTLIPLIVLSARGIELAYLRLRAATGPAGAAGAAAGAPGLRPADPVLPRLAAAILVLALPAVLLFVPWRAKTKYHHFRGMTPEVAALARTHGFGNDLVFVRGAGPEQAFSTYSAAAIYNPPRLSQPGTVYVRDLGPESRRRLEDEFRGRRVWTIEMPHGTGAGPRLVQAAPGSEAR